MTKPCEHAVADAASHPRYPSGHCVACGAAPEQGCQAKAWYLYRRGDGNEGNFPRCTIQLTDDEAWQALPCLVANDYIAGRRVRRHIVRSLPRHVDGEPAFGLSTMVLEGPEGETAFGAAWLTAELEPIEDPEDYPSLPRWDTLRAALDRPAWRMFKERCK